VRGNNLKINKRVGFLVNDPGVIREHSKILSKDGKEVGVVSSGGTGPSIKKSIGMAWVDEDVYEDET
jgi:glycine cleavage system aminomethyltransferase T